MKKYRPFIFLLFITLICAAVSAQPYPESLPPLREGFVPQSVQALWKDYDPLQEPLDVEILDEWKESGIICKVLRYRIGVFKGKRSMMAAVYACPADGKNLPGLVQICGGGQSANINAVLTNAKRGYACISINWLGNPIRGLKNGQNWTWQGLNTDWGAVDGTQTSHNDHFSTLMADEKTIDSVYSPRNSNWFLGIMAVRRAISFLTIQKEVNPELIGVYGHSMGAMLTFDVAAVDKRVKVAAPSAGAQLEREDQQESDLRWRTIASRGYAPFETSPVIFLNPSNDFNGRIDDIEQTLDAIPAKNYMLTRDPHLDHRTQPDHVVCGLLWMDQYLKKSFTFPKNPEISFSAAASGHIPLIRVKPDVSSDFLGVDIYYACGGEPTGRYWEWVQAKKEGDIWYAECPVLSTDETFRVFANVRYSLHKPVTGASFYYEIYTTDKFTISSRMLTLKPNELRLLNVKATDSTSLMIEPFDSNWEKRWYEFTADGKWPYRSHKLNVKKWQAPGPDAVLALDILCPENNTLQIELDDYVTTAELKGKDDWQQIALKPSDFKLKNNLPKRDKPETLPAWTSFKELSIGPKKPDDTKQSEAGNAADWNGRMPVLRNLRWKPAE